MGLNYAKLNWKIGEVCGTQGNLAKRIGLSEHSLSFKLKQKTEFKASEILKIAEVLGLSNEDIGEYFFTRNVQRLEQPQESAS